MACPIPSPTTPYRIRIDENLIARAVAGACFPTVTSSMQSLLAGAAGQLPRILLLFAYSLLFALVEVEIEGPHGWAETLPTWYRVRPWYARLFGIGLSG